MRASTITRGRLGFISALPEIQYGHQTSILKNDVQPITHQERFEISLPHFMGGFISMQGTLGIVFQREWKSNMAAR